MSEAIAISTLNDFIFCPYSIYLHNVYMETDEMTYHAYPQTKGRAAHDSVDQKTASTRKDILMSLPVYSERYGLFGKIDIFNILEKKLIERKYKFSQIFQGQIYQLWAQMFCLQEMGYDVQHVAFYEISTNKTIPIQMPTAADIEGFEKFLCRFRNYDPAVTPITINTNKCAHCIYCNLCDKTNQDNVYA